ncbi:GNAT family N-acetyltransferase [Clostridium neuense]|uniref:GNAT family N-acetyltransferase n=1 Tax=Clostridium neuense TaxID=1728934 RepID=A0ABW8TGE9_9CLOT
MINKKIMMDCVYKQLAIDYNCSPDDFLKDGLIFTEAKQNEGRRPFPWITPRLEMITMGNSIVINASADILPLVYKQLEGKTRYEALNMPFVYGVNPYFLPDLDKITLLNRNKEFEYETIERDDIQKLYILKDFNYALQYDINSQHPEMVAVIAKYKDTVVGIASASGECKTMWQVCVDVIRSYRENKLATILVNKLTLEVLKRGYIPYYSTDCSNVISQRVAVQAGYLPAWSHCFRTRLGSLLKP